MTELSLLDEKQKKLAISFQDLNGEIPSFEVIWNQIEKSLNPEKVKSYLEKMDLFFGQYDDFNMEKIDFFFQKSQKRIETEFSLLQNSNLKSQKKIKNLKTLFDQNYLEYNKRKHFFKTEQDTKRLEVAIKILPLYGKFAREIKILKGENPNRSFGNGDLQPFIDTIPQFIQLLDRYIVLLWNAFFRNKETTPDRAPLIEALANIQTRLVKIHKIEVAWDGLENLKNTNHDGKTIHLFAMNHANSFLDTSAQQEFSKHLKGISSIGDVDIFFPPYLLRRLIACKHFVAIGHGDSNSKTIELIRKKQLNKFFLAVEGITGVGLFEMRPIMPTFARATYEVLSKGLDVQLYPVVYPDNFTLLNDWRIPLTGRKVSRGILQKPISTLQCIKIKELTGSENALSTLIRWGWFKELKNSDHEVLSMPYPTEIEKNLEELIWGN